MFGVQSPFVAGKLTPHAGIIFDYAHNPFVLRENNSSDNVGAVVAHQMFLHLNASLALWNRVNLNLDLPFAIVQSGDSPQPNGGRIAISVGSSALPERSP